MQNFLVKGQYRFGFCGILWYVFSLERLGKLYILQNSVITSFLYTLCLHKMYTMTFLEVLDISYFDQKQPFTSILSKSCSESLAKFTGKHLLQNLFFNKVILSHGCFLVDIAKSLRTPIYRTHPLGASDKILEMLWEIAIFNIVIKFIIDKAKFLWTLQAII